MPKILFYNKFIKFLYTFRALFALKLCTGQPPTGVTIPYAV